MNYLVITRLKIFKRRMIFVDIEDTFTTVSVKPDNSKGYIYLNFPIKNDVIQLAFDDRNYYKNESFDNISISGYVINEFYDNVTHINDAKKYLQDYLSSGDGTLLKNFVKNFYKSAIEYELKINSS